MERNAQLIRLLSLIRDLSEARAGLLIRDLGKKYGVTRRTIERDLQAVQAAGYEVETLADDEPGRVRKRRRCPKCCRLFGRPFSAASEFGWHIARAAPSRREST